VMQSLYFFNVRIFLYVVLCINGLVQAEIPFTWINGLYAVTKNNHQLSVINGLVWYRQNIVKNMYDIWVKRPETMKDNTIKLIEEIFYLQRDGVSFLPTKRADKIATYFTPHVVGSIIAVIQQYRKKDTYDKHEFVAHIQHVMSKALQENLQAQKEILNEKIIVFKEHIVLLEAVKQLTNFSKKIINLQQISKDVRIYVKKLFNVDIDTIAKKDLIPDKLSSLQAMQNAREKKYSGLNTMTGTHRKKVIDQMVYDLKALERVTQVDTYVNLAQLLVGSVEESTHGRANQHYIVYTTEQILLAFVWAKSDTRKDFKDFFDALGQKYVNQKALDNWVNNEPEYTRKDYNEFQNNFNKIDAKAIAQFVGTQYETAVFAVRAYYMWEQTLPFIFAGTTVEYKKDKNSYSFPDCGETSLRNFFDIVLKNLPEGKFDISYLLNAKSVNDAIPLKISVSDKLVAFYKKNFSFDNVTSLQLYNDWTYVVEGLTDVHYIEPKNESEHFYEIDSGVNNILQVLNVLLFANSEKFKQLSKQQKLDLICKQLSRDNFKISWRAVDDNGDPVDVNTHDFLTLKFEVETDGKQVFFEWKFEEKHFILSAQSTSYPIAHDKVDAIALQMNNIEQEDKISLYTLLGCYANRDNFELICEAAGKGLSSDQLIQLIYFFYDLKADWGIWGEQLRELNRARMILGIAKNASEDTALVNLFLSEWLLELPLRSSLDIQKAMAQELLTFNQVHTGSLSFITNLFLSATENIDIRMLSGIASFIQKLDVKDSKQKMLLNELVLRIVKGNMQNLFPVAIQKMNELDVQDCMRLIGNIAQIKPAIAEQFIYGLIPITSSVPLLNFFITNGKLNNRTEVVSRAEQRRNELLGGKSIVEESNPYEYDVD
jgi:hypothetical protein